MFEIHEGGGVTLAGGVYEERCRIRRNSVVAAKPLKKGGGAV